MLDLSRAAIDKSGPKKKLNEASPLDGDERLSVVSSWLDALIPWLCSGHSELVSKEARKKKKPVTVQTFFNILLLVFAQIRMVRVTPSSIKSRGVHFHHLKNLFRFFLLRKLQVAKNKKIFVVGKRSSSLNRLDGNINSIDYHWWPRACLIFLCISLKDNCDRFSPLKFWWSQISVQQLDRGYDLDEQHRHLVLASLLSLSLSLSIDLPCPLCVCRRPQWSNCDNLHSRTDLTSDRDESDEKLCVCVFEGNIVHSFIRSDRLEIVGNGPPQTARRFS